MDPEWDTLTGVLVVRDQAHLVGLTIESAAPALDRVHVVDNHSEDDTVAVIEAAADAVGLPLEIERRKGYVGELFLETMQEYAGDYVFRLEGDQVYWPGRLARLKEAAERDRNVAARVVMLRNYCHLENSDHPVNAAHPTIYPVDGSNRMVDGKLWPRSRTHQRAFPDLGTGDFELNVMGVNCKVLPPAERAKRFHRATWWRWGNRDVPDMFCLDEAEMPYQESMSLETYIWRLYEGGKGAAATEWGAGEHFESLADMGRALIEWDIENNCQFYAGPYPPVLEAAIGERGYGLGVV